MNGVCQMTFLVTKCCTSWLEGGSIALEYRYHLFALKSVKNIHKVQSSRNDRKSFNLAKNAQKIPLDFSYSEKSLVIWLQMPEYYIFEFEYIVWVAVLSFSYLKIQYAEQPQVGHKFHFWWSQFWSLNIYWTHTHSKFNSKWPSQAMTHHFLPAHRNLQVEIPILEGILWGHPSFSDHWLRLCSI